MGLAVAARCILVQLRDASSGSCGCHVGRYRRDALSAAQTCRRRFAKPVSSSRMTLGACDFTIVELNTDNDNFFFFHKKEPIPCQRQCQGLLVLVICCIKRLLCNFSEREEEI